MAFRPAVVSSKRCADVARPGRAGASRRSEKVSPLNTNGTKPLLAPLLAPMTSLGAFPALALDDTLDRLQASTTKYVPSPMEPGWQVYVGAIVGTIPFIIATYEFSKRIIIQRRCRVCNGTGLVLKGKSQYYKKCRNCGGFLPWLGWRAFLTGSLTGIANGSPVLPPQGQTSVLYKVPRIDKDEEDTRSAASKTTRE